MRIVDGLLAGPRWLLRIWRRSLLLRVTVTTLVLSTVVMMVLGFLLLSRVTTGLLDSKERASVVEASAGVGEAQRLLDAADTGATTPSAARLVDSVVNALAARAGSPSQFDVLLLSSGDVTAPERGTNLVAVSSVPPALRAAVTQSQRESWTYTQIRFLDGRSAPGLVVGAPLRVPTVGDYELYYLFPLAEEQLTLDLVRGAVIITGLLLVILLGFVAWLVTRQVVAPVRATAQTASRFSDGYLSERVRVRGEDDLAQLATSFNDMAASLQRQIKQLEDLSRVQQRFVSDVSHELRTPLTTIRMAADVMFEDRSHFDAPTARAAELLQTQLDRFEALLVDLLEIFKQLNEKHFDGFLDPPVLRWNGRLRTASGRFFPGARQKKFGLRAVARPPIIEVASYLLQESEGELHIRETLAHEMIHYWLWVRSRPHGHTDEFYAKMTEMGARRYNPVPRRLPPNRTVW